MKVYVVGGAVRDELLGLPVKDRDYVVVGASPERMIEQGYMPVGSDFPVFLHPETKEEHALARTERKTAPGYKGFVFHASPEVTLEEDLDRRDFTINAMARDEDGRLIDPHGGEHDLRLGLLRHVSDAFAEDPVRILRAARFAARFGFAVAPGTMALMRAMVEAGEADALVPERVWQEVSRGLMELKPSRMFEVLRASGALARVLPELEALMASPAGESAITALDEAARRKATLPVRFATLLRFLPGTGAVESASARLKAPSECRDLAVLSTRECARVFASATLPPEELLGLVERCDALRRPARFIELIEACDCARGPGAGAFAQRELLRTVLSAVQSVDAGAIAATRPADLPGAIHAARLAAIQALRRNSGA
jgi:tRNA nucleotidyltransferase (CCA-adding enzyme)